MQVLSAAYPLVKWSRIVLMYSSGNIDTLTKEMPAGSYESLRVEALPQISPQTAPLRSPHRSPKFLWKFSTGVPARCESLISKWTVDWWATELLFWLAAAISLSAIILTLAIHEDRSIPQWPLKITINTVLAILSQIASMSLVAAVAASISQLKWIWFTKTKNPLADFEAFDDASRGPWGSVLLLCRLHFRSVCTL